MSTTMTIARREFRSSFDSPLAYVVICLGLILLGFVFFYLNGGFWQGDRATLTTLFLWAPRGLSFLVVPVVTMRLLAEERKSGTLEMLITLPVKDHAVILGKFLGAWGLVLLLIGSTSLYPILMFGMRPWLIIGAVIGVHLLYGVASGTLLRDPTPFLLTWAALVGLGFLVRTGGASWHLGPLDEGPVLAGYLGLVLYSAAAVSIGLLISALTESQVIAFFLTFIVLFTLHFIGFGADGVSPMLRGVISFISFDTRLAPFARGMVSTRDVVYFVSITAGCLMAAFRALERRKWA